MLFNYTFNHLISTNTLKQYWNASISYRKMLKRWKQHTKDTAQHRYIWIKVILHILKREAIIFNISFIFTKTNKIKEPYLIISKSIISNFDQKYSNFKPVKTIIFDNSSSFTRQIYGFWRGETPKKKVNKRQNNIKQ